MPSADSSADDESAARDVELTSEPGADSTSMVRPSASIKDGNWDKPRSVPAPAPVVAAPRPGQTPARAAVAPVAALPGAFPPPLPLPTPPLAVPPPSVAPPANVAPSGMPSVSSLSPRPIPSLDPRPITAADLEDDFRTPFLSSLVATRPTNTWLSLGMVLVGVAFVVGLLLGRTSASGARMPPTGVASKTQPESDPVTPASAAVAAASPNEAPATSTVAAPVPAEGAPAAVASSDPAAADATKSAPAKAQLEAFNAKAAHINLTNAAARAMHCRDATAPAGTVSTVVTFVPSGRVADVTVTTPAYAGTHTGKCIIAKLKGAQVPPYSGEPETLKKTITLK